MPLDLGTRNSLQWKMTSLFLSFSRDLGFGSVERLTEA